MLKNKILFFYIILIVGIINVNAQKSDFFEVGKQIEIYSSVIKELDMYYIDEVNVGELNDKTLRYMLSQLDPYTNFYDEYGIEATNIKRSGEYAGIGIETRFKDKHLIITEVYANTPAAEKGLKAGDEIIKIDNLLVKKYDQDNSLSSILRGTPGTTVEIGIDRQGETLNKTITRAKVNVQSVPFWGMVDNSVGYIAFDKFTMGASDQIYRAFNELKTEGMEQLILDLRANPGGLLNEAVKITNLFIPQNKVVVTTKAKIRKWSNSFKTKEPPLDLDIPIVVLINNRSASASEIVSGSLQDYDRAVVMGQRSFGKGLVQQYRKLPFGSQMKLTISKYYTPSGRCIQELDYASKKPNGEIPKFPESPANTFKTSNGRAITDGGGILPDIVIDKPKTLDITKSLIRSEAFFNFITDFTIKNSSIDKPELFKLKSSIYDDLMSYLKNHPKDFQTILDKKLDNFMTIAKKDGLYDGVETDFKKLQNAIQQQQIKQLYKNQSEIIEVLTSEIVKRYYFRKGVYEQKLHFDPVIVQAKTLLHDIKKYKKILQ